VSTPRPVHSQCLARAPTKCYGQSFAALNAFFLQPDTVAQLEPQHCQRSLEHRKLGFSVVTKVAKPILSKTPKRRAGHVPDGPILADGRVGRLRTIKRPPPAGVDVAQQGVKFYVRFPGVATFLVLQDDDPAITAVGSHTVNCHAAAIIWESFVGLEPSVISQFATVFRGFDCVRPWKVGSNLIVRIRVGCTRMWPIPTDRCAGSNR
jgi:hypothetical protein